MIKGDKKPQIVLASKSPRRREFFSIVTENFLTFESDVNENKYNSFTAKEQVMFLANDKCVYASQYYIDSVIVACDTLVELNGLVMGKPKDKEEAFLMLSALSGNTHTVYTGVAIKIGEEIDSFVSKTDVTFLELQEEEINEYINTGEPLDKAGAYGIQGKAARFIKGIDGDYFNVLGLPISAIYRNLHAKHIV